MNRSRLRWRARGHGLCWCAEKGRGFLEHVLNANWLRLASGDQTPIAVLLEVIPVWLAPLSDAPGACCGV